MDHFSLDSGGRDPNTHHLKQQQQQRQQQYDDLFDDPFAELHRLEETFYQEGYALGQADGTTLGRTEGRVFGSKRAFDRFFDMARMHGHTVVLGNRLPLMQQQQQQQQQSKQTILSSSTSSLSSPLSALPAESRPGGAATAATRDEAATHEGQETTQANRGKKGYVESDPNLNLLPEPNYNLAHLAPLLPLGSTGPRSTASSPPPPPPSMARIEKHLRTLFALSEPASLSLHNTEQGVSEFDDRLRRAQAKARIINRMLPAAKTTSLPPSSSSSLSTSIISPGSSTPSMSAISDSTSSVDNTGTRITSSIPTSAKDDWYSLRMRDLNSKTSSAHTDNTRNNNNYDDDDGGGAGALGAGSRSIGDNDNDGANIEDSSILRVRH